MRLRVAASRWEIDIIGYIRHTLSGYLRLCPSYPETFWKTSRLCALYARYARPNDIL